MRTQMRVLVRTSVVFLISSGAWAQPPAPPLTFEVASIKPSAPSKGNFTKVGCSGGPGSTDPGRVICENMPLSALVLKVYGAQPYQLSAPTSLMSQYDIVAKVPANTGADQVLVMWRNLLAERFQLKVHRENKEMAVYALVVAKGGSKLVEADPNRPTSPRAAGACPSAAACGSSAGYRCIASDLDIASLVRSLSIGMDRPVIDETGLKGRFIVKLEYQKEDLSTSDSERFSCPTIFAAMKDQLGLELLPRHGPVEMLVIDHFEKVPIGN